MATTNPTTNRIAEARHLAWELMDDGSADGFEQALELAYGLVPELVALAAEWDAQASEPEPTPPAPAAAIDPKIEAAWQRAAAKAEWEHAGGARPRFRNGRALVSSRTRGGVVHVVDGAGRCSCEAGSQGRPCWHVWLVSMAAGDVAQAA